MPFLEKHSPKDFDQSLVFYWTAWTELNPSRHRSMGGPSGIPFSEICRWMDERDLRPQRNRDFCISLVQRMDSTYLTYVGEKMKRETDKGSKGK